MALEETSQQIVAAETRRAGQRLIMGSALKSAPMNIINALALSLLLLGHVDPTRHGLWLAAVCGCALIRVAMVWRLRRSDRDPSRFEAVGYIVMSALLGLSWGATPFLIEGAVPIVVSATMALVLAGMAAGAAMTNAADLRVVMAFNLPLLSLWGVSLAISGGWQGYVAGAMMVGFVFIMLTLTRGYARALSDAVRAKAALEEAGRHNEAQAAALSRLAEHNEKEARRAEHQARAGAALIANMSHELRAPLNGVLGMAQLLAECTLDPEQRRMARRVKESGDLLNRLLGDVLDVSRIEAGRLELFLEDVTARSLSEKARKRFEPAARAKNLAFEVQVAGDADRALRGDGDRILQLAGVFIENAIRFTDQGGVTVAFTTRETATGECRLRLQVRDTGSGVPESARGQMFDSLAAENLDPSIREAGTGLGLHLAKRLASLMDGQVGHEQPSSGQGSIFWADVALKPSGKADRWADGEQFTYDQRRLRMLVGEADPSRRSVLLGYLKSFNCAVTTVSSCDELLEALGGAAYDAAVLGLSLSDSEPAEAAADIRRLPSTAAMTPVVRLAVGLEAPFQQTASETHVRSPVTADALLDALNAALASDPAAQSNLRRVA